MPLGIFHARPRWIISVFAALMLCPAWLSAGVQYSVGLEGLVGRTSSGGSLASMEVRVGTFSGGFVPTTENYSQWLANFRPLLPAQLLAPDLTAFVAGTLPDSGPWIMTGRTATIHEGQDPAGFTSGARLYVWVSNTTSLTGSAEAALLTDPGWIYEVATEEPHPGVTLVLSSSTVEVLVGGLFKHHHTDAGGESGIRLVTAAVDNVVKINGLWTRAGNLAPGEQQLVNFEISGLKYVLFNVGGGVSWKLFDGSNNLLASSDLMGDFSFARVLSAGIYTLVLSGEDIDAGDPQNYELEIDASESATLRPDLAVGPSPSRLRGSGIFGGSAGQSVDLIARRAKSVNGFATATNRGNAFGRIRLNGSRGNRLFRVTYRGSEGNITARVIGAGYASKEMAPLDPPEWLATTIQPNRKVLTKRVGGRSMIQRRSLTISVRAVSLLDPSSIDQGWIRVETR